MISITMNDGKGNSRDYWVRIENLPNGKVETHVIEREFYRMKEIATAIQCVADDTGYDFDFLSGAVDELVKEDGATYEEAVKTISEIAYEYDF